MEYIVRLRLCLSFSVDSDNKEEALVVPNDFIHRMLKNKSLLAVDPIGNPEAIPLASSDEPCSKASRSKKGKAVQTMESQEGYPHLEDIKTHADVRKWMDDHGLPSQKGESS